MENMQISISSDGLDAMIKNRVESTDGKDYLWTTNIEVELPIFLQKTGPQSQPPQTMSSIFVNSCRRNKDKPALLEYNKKTQNWTALTYQDYLDSANSLARAFIALGIKSKSCIGILSYNCAKWFLSFYGSILADCVPAGLYMSNSPETCQQVLEDCKAPIIFVEDNDQLGKILQIWKNLPHLKYVVTYNKVDIASENPNIMTFENLLSLGVKNAPHMDLELASRISKQKPGHCAVLVYTSGTTGVGKGTMLSHDACCMFIYYLNLFKCPENARIISYLPVSHIASMSTDIFASAERGWAVYFADKEALKGSLADYIKMVKPTIFLGVPRIYEKIQDKIEKKISDVNIVKRTLFKISTDAAYEDFRNVLEGKEPGWKYKLAKKLVLDKIKKEIGFDETLYFLSGAAPLQENTHKFFAKIGLFINNAYGLSETTGGITILYPYEFHEYSFNSCGRAMEGCELLFGDEKEIMFRSRTCFMGYLNKEEDTKKMIDNKRRVHTGDVGMIDDKNRLFIKGRIKELIITAGGENIAPYPIENKIMEKLKGFASWAIVIGDSRQYLSLLITIRNANDLMQKPCQDLETDTIKELAQHGITATTMAQLMEEKNFEKLSKVIQDAINYANSHSVSNASKIRNWTILPRDLSIATEELTPTLKLKRKKVENHFKKEIEATYSKPQL